MRYADLDDKILLYDNEQTDAINKNATDIENIKDYIIDSGIYKDDLDYIYWEKWNSGKLIQEGRFSITTESSRTTAYTLPQKYTTGTLKSVVSSIIERSSISVRVYMSMSSSDQLIITSFDGNTQVSESFNVSFRIIGEWK